jgi:molybdate transport system substrate-binding protein
MASRRIAGPRVSAPRFLAAILALCLIAAGFGPAQAGENRPLLVFAASSLQTSLTRIAADWKARTGQAVTLSFAASSQLARQIEQGAPADLFLSADLDWMGWAQARKLIDVGSRRNIAGNALVLIEPADARTDLAIAPGFPLAAALGDSRLAMGMPQTVPAGRYSQLALQSLGIWDKVAPHVAGVENVRAALALVARGEARFGIVYLSDARSDPRVRVVGTFPPESHPAVIYPAALTAGSVHPAARAFLDHLGSAPAQAILAAEGFETSGFPSAP